MTDPVSTEVPPLTPRRVLYALVGLALHLVAGFFMLVSGLVAPPWAVTAMLVVWAVLLVLGIRRWRTRPWITIAVPVLAFAVWLATLAAGGAFLDWRA